MGDPLLVAICGRPTSGKSEVQKLLARHYGLEPVDDGWILRKHCMELFGLALEDVSTQEGKQRHSTICGNPWENRKIVGEYGAALEERFGPYVIPAWAVRFAQDHFKTLDRGNNLRGYSFGSVRREQGRYYRERGAMILEIVRPGVQPTGNIWDEYDQSAVTHTFINDASSVEELETAFLRFFDLVQERSKTAFAGVD